MEKRPTHIGIPVLEVLPLLIRRQLDRLVIAGRKVVVREAHERRETLLAIDDGVFLIAIGVDIFVQEYRRRRIAEENRLHEVLAVALIPYAAALIGGIHLKKLSPVKINEP